MLCCWGWHISRDIQNNPRCKNQFTSLKHVLKRRENQLKDAWRGKKWKQNRKIANLLIGKLHRSSQGHSWDRAIPKGPAKLQTWGSWNTFKCLGGWFLWSTPLWGLDTAWANSVLVFPVGNSQQVKLDFKNCAGFCCYFCLQDFFLFWFSSIRTGRYMDFYLYCTNSTVSFHLGCIIVVYLKYHVHSKCYNRAVWSLVPFLFIFIQLTVNSLYN